MKLSLKAAKALAIYSPESGPLSELRAAIARATRASTTRRQLRAPKVAKRKAKREATSEIRAAVMARADGRCEACRVGHFAVLHMDHFFGRAKAPQSVENCWALCRSCDREKTDNVPDAAWWLDLFIAHAEKYGYASEVKRASDRLAFVRARGAA